MEEFCIPTYIINLPERKEHLTHILSQFRGKEEFDINIIQPSGKILGASGLWDSICKIIQLARDRDEEVIIICEDDHEFTKEYDRDKLIQSIIEANRLQANFLLGGIYGGFRNLLPLQSGIFWLDAFYGTQFIIIFSYFYETILAEPFLDLNLVDVKLSKMTSNKFLMYPMISKQKKLGDCNFSENKAINEQLRYLDKSTNIRMEKINKAFLLSLSSQ